MLNFFIAFLISLFDFSLFNYCITIKSIKLEKISLIKKKDRL